MKRNNSINNEPRGHLTAAPFGRESDDYRLTSNETDSRTRFGPGGGVYRIVTTAAESQGRHFAFVAIEPPGGGPRLHTHATEDEYFLVLKGEISFYINGRVSVAKPGESAFVPRGTPHCFKNCSVREAQVLVLFTPGNIEGFFDFGLPQNGESPSEEHSHNRISELGPKYGLEVLGPSPLCSKDKESYNDERHDISEIEPSGEWLQSRPGERFSIRIPASATNGAYSVTEILSSPSDSTPVHLHENEDEHVLVLEGTARIKCGDKTFDAPAGTMISLPRGIPHAWGNPTGTPLRLLTTATPGGVEEALRLIATSGEQLDLRALSDKYAVRLIGPPLLGADRRG